MESLCKEAENRPYIGPKLTFMQFNCSDAGIPSSTAWHFEGWWVLFKRVWSANFSSLPCREGLYQQIW
jgi:hypothetical protein